MPEATRPIAMIPSDCFRWQPRVQFIDSFRTRESALNYAFEHGYNLIVERNEESYALFDVLDDPDGACTSELDLELLKTEEVLVDPYTGGWSNLVISSTWNLVTRLGIGVAGVCARQIAPRLRHATSRSRMEEFRNDLGHLWGRFRNWDAAGHAKMFGIRCLAFYQRVLVPSCRAAVRRSWWSGPAISLRRGWHRHSQGSAKDFARSVAAEASVLYFHGVLPWFRSALSRCRQADIQGACSRTWSVTLLTAIRVTDRSAAAVAHLYLHDVAPRLRRAAARYQQADIEGTFRRSLVVVAHPPRSNAHQVH
jgi:hypothetical protein